MKCRPQFFHGGHVERVEHFGPVDGDVSDRVFLFEKYVFEVHKFIFTTETQREPFFSLVYFSLWLFAFVVNCLSIRGNPRKSVAKACSPSASPGPSNRKTPCPFSARTTPPSPAASAAEATRTAAP